MDNRIHVMNRQRKVQTGFDAADVIRSCAETVLRQEGFKGPAEVDVILVSDRVIRGYNKAFREIDRATDVLSFPANDFKEGGGGFLAVDLDEGGAVMLGDIVISLERARAQAAEYGHGLEREVGFLTVHAMLHLLGCDHETEPDRQEMRAKEEAVLSALKLGR
jgi:probable rRNA maturation factor